MNRKLYLTSAFPARGIYARNITAKNVSSDGTPAIIMASDKVLMLNFEKRRS
jgi:hypothetical protein